MLFEHDGHYEVAKSAGKLFGRSDYCPCCQTTHDRLRVHSCTCVNRCHNCLGMKDGTEGNVCEAEQGVTIHFKECGDTFHNDGCYIRHKKNACSTYAKCEKCKCKCRKRAKSKHKCGETYCRTCNQPMQFDHHCHIQKMKTPEFENYRVVVWVVETILSKEIPDEGDADQEEDTDEPDWGEDKLPHRVNTLRVRVACRDCIESGLWKDKDYHGCAACGPDRCRVFDGEDPVDGFLDYVINELPTPTHTTEEDLTITSSCRSSTSEEENRRRCKPPAAIFSSSS